MMMTNQEHKHTDEVINLENELLKRNVNDHVEKKQNLSYLSWAWAWAEALKADPNATFEVHTFDGKPYMDVNGTGMVWVTVKLGWKQRTCFLPVMDYKNKPITNPDAFAVNTAIMRCMTKCLALFGLGLYIYAGEDLPEDGEVKQEEPKPKVVEKPKPVVDEQEKANLTLFADGLLKFLEIAKDEQGLKSYWKANQGQIDQLKAKIPDLYSLVVEKFQEAKTAMKEKANG